jgi:iron complex transport system permease protein
VASLITSRKAKLLVLLALLALMLAGMLASMTLGIQRFSLSVWWEALFHFNGTNDHLMIRTVKLPSALIGAAVGASLAVAGALMQVLTRNPLASPSVLGVNAGAVLFIVMAITVLGSGMALGTLIWIASCPRRSASTRKIRSQASS